MATEIKIPKSGYEATVAKIIEWHQKEGDPVEEDDLLVTVETQKASIEITAPCTGILRKIIVDEDSEAKEGQTIGVISEADENIDEILKGIYEQAEGSTPSADQVSEKISDTPSQSDQEEIIPLTGSRKQMAEHMLHSITVAAHGTTFNEADVSKALALAKESQKKISFTAVLVQAAVRALQAFPLINASSTAEKIIIKKYYHIGVAHNTEKALLVPVIKDADKKDLEEITEDLRRLISKAEAGTLTPDELQGGTFTISNGGRYGSLFFVPIINQPQSAILGTGTITQRPMVVDNQIVIRTMMNIFVSYDHRIIPGAVAQQFLSKLKEGIETP